MGSVLPNSFSSSVRSSTCSAGLGSIENLKCTASFSFAADTSLFATSINPGPHGGTAIVCSLFARSVGTTCSPDTFRSYTHCSSSSVLFTMIGFDDASKSHNCGKLL